MEQTVRAKQMDDGYLNDTVQQNIGRESKFRIYKRVLRPLMTYASETTLACH